MSAATDVSVVIARGELLAALRDRLAFDPAVLVFSTAETSHALSVIVQRNMAMIALDRQFAESSGGATFIAAASQPVACDARRARRYAVISGCQAIVNGEPTAVVNVSIVGAQMLSPTVLRPLQHVRIALPIENAAAIRVPAAIAWSVFERSRTTGQTHYRVGIEFQTPHVDLLEAFCSTHAARV